MTDPRTIAVYDARANAYAALETDTPRPSLLAFIAALPPGGAVLDLGCGPGSAAAHMMTAGLHVDAIDASQAMVALARARGVPARVAGFDDVAGTAIYDGVWASFSLLHASRTDLPRHIGAIADALRPGGLFHIAMKTGTGTRRDPIDRLYTYVTEAELRSLLCDGGLIPVDVRTGVDKGLAGTDDPFIVIQARKAPHA
ncbi:MAG: class I SAM-dependent methyltransferase [Alphaproteobacteria bacterium]|nr:class I SAM-dependent methyltransferase [Alphaproteobacteria bacterium]